MNSNESRVCWVVTEGHSQSWAEQWLGDSHLIQMRMLLQGPAMEPPITIWTVTNCPVQ